MLNRVLPSSMVCLGLIFTAFCNAQDSSPIEGSFVQLVTQVNKLDKKVRKLKTEIKTFDYVSIEPAIDYQSIGIGTIGVMLSSAVLYKLFLTNKSLPSMSSLWSLYKNPHVENENKKVAAAYMIQKIGLCCAQLVCLSALLLSGKNEYLQGLNPQKALSYSNLAQLAALLYTKEQQLRTICNYLGLRYDRVCKKLSPIST